MFNSQKFQSAVSEIVIKGTHQSTQFVIGIEKIVINGFHNVDINDLLRRLMNEIPYVSVSHFYDLIPMDLKDSIQVDKNTDYYHDLFKEFYLIYSSKLPILLNMDDKYANYKKHIKWMKQTQFPSKQEIDEILLYCLWDLKQRSEDRTQKVENFEKQIIQDYGYYAHMIEKANKFWVSKSKREQMLDELSIDSDWILAYEPFDRHVSSYGAYPLYTESTNSNVIILVKTILKHYFNDLFWYPIFDSLRDYMRLFQANWKLNSNN